MSMSAEDGAQRRVLDARDLVVRRRGDATRDRDPVVGGLVDRLRRLGPVEVRVRDVRGRRLGRAVRRRRVARQRRVAPAVGIGLHAAERRPREARALVGVAQHGRAGARRVVVVVVGRDVQAHVIGIDGRRQVGHRDLDLEVVAAPAVGVVGRRVVGADPVRGRGDLHAGRVGRVVDRARQRAGRVALVVVGVALPARAVDAVAVGAGRVVGVREDAELERVGGVLEPLRGVAARIDQQLDRVRLPVADALRRGDRVALEVVADVDEEVQIVAVARDLGVGAVRRPRRARGAAVDADRRAVARAPARLPLAADVERLARVVRALAAVDGRRGRGLRDRRLRDDSERQVLRGGAASSTWS